MVPVEGISRFTNAAIALDLLSYAIVMIAGGHGAGPVGMLMIAVLAPMNLWFPAAALGWAGIALLIVSSFFRSRSAYILC